MSEEELRSVLLKRAPEKVAKALSKPRLVTSASAYDECCSEPPPDAARYLWVHSGSYVSGYSADAEGGAFIEAGGGNAWISVSSTTKVSQGRQIPNYYDNNCYAVNQCSWGRYFNVNCYDDDFEVTSSTTGSAYWVWTRAGPATARSGYFCLAPAGAFGGGGDDTGDFTEGPTSGGGKDCNYYIIEQSDDGGNTWREIGRFSDC
jgi:hypothetical protein